MLYFSPINFDKIFMRLCIIRGFYANFDTNCSIIIDGRMKNNLHTPHNGVKHCSRDNSQSRHNITTSTLGNFPMRKKIFFILLFFTPILFFLGLRLLRYLIGSDIQESLKMEIIGSIICGYGVSLGLWYHYRRANKKE